MNRAERRELWAGVRQGVAVASVALVIGLPAIHLWRSHYLRSGDATPAVTLGAGSVAGSTTSSPVNFGAASPPPDVRSLAVWARASGDHLAMPFAIIDKRRTQLYVFDATGRLLGQTPVLLGFAPGDHSVPGIGQRPLKDVRPDERTTPAGRFVAVSGRNATNDPVIWVDYGAAVSMHRVRPVLASERRLERLATPTSDDNRISYGCINVPVAFFDQVVWPTLGGRRSVVYVMPDSTPFEAVFPPVASPSSRTVRTSHGYQAPPPAA